NIDLKLINELFLLCQPAFLQVLKGSVMDPEERDIKRAEMFKEKLFNGGV
ncbi:MAG: ATP--guanido phosphotransferase, partial [Clostridia bacterium]|nr:ATP--guanido phosphotransferase [Clostridia bacterium]